MKGNNKLIIAILVFILITFILIAILISTTMNKRKALSKISYEGSLGSPYFHNRNWDNSYFCEGNLNNCDNSYFCDGNRNNCENNAYVHHGNRNGSHLHNRKCNNYNF